MKHEIFMHRSRESMEPKADWNLGSAGDKHSKLYLLEMSGLREQLKKGPDIFLTPALIYCINYKYLNPRRLWIVL